MYPKYDDSILDFGCMCRILDVLSASTLLIRTSDMCDVYTPLYESMQSFYRSGYGNIIHVDELRDGLACVVYRHYYACRGEIIHSDKEDGYSEVKLVDEGGSIYVEACHLYWPSPFAASITALSLEVHLYELRDLHLEGIEERLVEMCMGATMEVVGVSRTIDNKPLVSLYDEEGFSVELIIAYVLGNTGDVIDEGFDEYPIAIGIPPED